RLTPEEQLTIEIFKRSTPSVVNVTNLAVKRDAFTMNMLEMPQGQGSGFIWDSAGHVVTNYHVIQDASDIKVTLADGEEFSARVVGVDQDKDIAVLQIGPMGAAEREVQAAATGGPSADIVVGQKVFAIGNPFGLDHTLTVGVVSGTGREIQSISGRPIQDVIQTDAAINPGNSGGPLLDSGGCLIGINTAIYSPTGANNGVGFAIPVDIVKSSVGQIIQYGKVTRPMLGISFAPDVSSEALGIKAGILVLSTREGGPAWKAGLKGSTRDEYGRLVLGDIITAVNGIKIKSSSDLYRVLDKCQVGDTLHITVLRENSTFEVDVTLEPSSPWPNPSQQQGAQQGSRP
ncbi:trypsin family, partial [Volvox carteri f. nagariensis]